MPSKFLDALIDEMLKQKAMQLEGMIMTDRRYYTKKNYIDLCSDEEEEVNEQTENDKKA